jgi:hypothetical protein
MVCGLAVGPPPLARLPIAATFRRLAIWRHHAIVHGYRAAAWQLYAGVPASKADELCRLGVPSELGAAANLAYSVLGATVFAWLAVRWRRRNRDGADNEAEIRNHPTTVGHVNGARRCFAAGEPHLAA